MFETMAPPRAVIDPKDDPAVTGGGYRDRRVAVTFSDPRRVPDEDSVRFVPRDPYDPEAYDAVYRALFERRGVFVWLDEAGMAAPASGAPDGLRRLVTQGARFGIGHLALHQRAHDLDRALWANAEHVIAFRLGDPDDIRRLAGTGPTPPRDVEAALRSLPPFGFLWYGARDQRWRIIPGGVTPAP
jgi:DNA helicase HerA-like ATPase